MLVVMLNQSDKEWSAEVEELLTKASALCAEHGVDPDAFMQAAWAACLDSRPGLREQLVDQELTAQVDNLRSRGLVGSA
jgi:hypothetical protein